MNERDYQRLSRLRDDRGDVQQAAEWIAEQPAASGRGLAALSDPHVAAQCSSLLHGLAEHLDTLPAPVREHTARVSREMLGRPMDDPTRRRTRRR